MDMENAVICEKPHIVPNKKRKRCTDGLNNLNNSIDVCHDYSHGTTSVDDIPLVSSVSMSSGLVTMKVEDTTMAPAAATCNDLVHVPKKKRKKKKKKKPTSGSNNANTVNECCQDGASSECTVGINGKTSVEMSEPDADLSCPKKKKKKKKRKKKKDSDMEVAGCNATDVEESSLKKKKKRKKKKNCDMEVAANASNATDVEESSLKKKKKRKKKKNSDMEVDGSNGTDVEESSLKKKKKRKKKKNSDMEVAGSNATDVEESSLTTAKKSDLLTTENTDLLEVNHVLLGDKGCSGNTCPGDAITTSLETIPLGVHGVSMLAVEDIMLEKDSANAAGVLPADEKKKRRRKKKKKTGSKDRICGHHDMNVSEVVHKEKKNGVEVYEVHTRVDASNIEEDSACKGNGSDNLSAGDPSCKALEVDNILLEEGPSPDLDVLNDDINLQKGPLQDLDALNDDVNLEKAPSPDLDVLNDDVNLNTSVKDGELSQTDVPTERALVSHARKKLLILDVNGLLVDFVAYMPIRHKPDIVISKKAVFKRPYCDEFLQFCFDKFNVGVWSSRTKKNIDTVVNFLMPVSKHKLLFCWDQSHCTMTGFNTIENRNKPLVLKEIKKLWEKLDPDLPWEKGDYDQTNTLLLDDSPYKALRNPVNTAIFPYPYDYRDFNDTSLGPGGDLRVYLEKLAMAENVQKFVEQNPFGQKAITKSNPSWNFYCKILEPPR